MSEMEHVGVATQQLQEKINDIHNAAADMPSIRPPHCDFSTALFALKTGKRVRRNGWNGKGMYLAYQRGYPQGVAINANTASATGLPEGTVCTFLPYLMMKTVNENEFVPWLASQTDILAEDWELAD